MPITLDGTNGITTPTYGGANTSEYLVPVTGFKNRVINGNMSIDQRNAGASVTAPTSATGGGYTIDRWFMEENTDGAASVQQITDAPTGLSHSMRITVTSTDTSLASNQWFEIIQSVEGFNWADMVWGTANAKTVTLSFWVKSSLTGSFSGSMRNSAYSRSYPFAYTISSANTWEYKTVSITGDTTGTWVGATNGAGVRLCFCLAGGSSVLGTAGVWTAGSLSGATGTTNFMATNAATWQITGVQLEVGSTATSFDYRPYGTELALCQRYYEKSYDIATTPSTSTTTNACKYVSPRTVNPSAPDDIFSVPYIVSKRATPTITIYSTTGASGNVRDISNGADVASGGTTSGENSYSLRWSMTDTRFYAWQWVSSSEL